MYIYLILQDKRFQCAKETVEKQRSAKRRRLSSDNDKIAAPVDVEDLPQVFHDVSDVKEFSGFNNKDETSVHKKTSTSEGKKKKSATSVTKQLPVKRSVAICAYICLCVVSMYIYICEGAPVAKLKNS